MSIKSISKIFYCLLFFSLSVKTGDSLPPGKDKFLGYGHSFQQIENEDNNEKNKALANVYEQRDKKESIVEKPSLCAYYRWLKAQIIKIDRGTSSVSQQRQAALLAEFRILYKQKTI